MLKRTPPLNAEIDIALSDMDAIGQTIELITEQRPVDAREEPGLSQTGEEIMDLMAEHGWEYEGAGHFSLVFTKGSLAIKVGLKVQDSGAVYAAWARSQAGRPGVPQIYYIHRAASCYLVLTPRYYALSSLSMARRGALKGEIEAISDGLYHGRASATSSVSRTAVDIHEFFQGIATMDLHEGNVMVDCDMNIVITDPVSYAYTGGDYYYSNSTSQGSY